MNTGSLDERRYLQDIHRIADALERIAKVLERKTEEDED